MVAEKFVISTTDGCILAICQTRADAEEMVLSLAEEEAYETYIDECYFMCRGGHDEYAENMKATHASWIGRTIVNPSLRAITLLLNAGHLWIDPTMEVL